MIRFYIMNLYTLILVVLIEMNMKLW